jgi:hypothetical protein
MAPGGSAYDGESALPGASANTGAARDNKVMQIGRIAVATEFLNAMNTLGKSSGMDAFALEMEEKVVNVLRDIEYYIFKGDRTNTAPQEMDGLLTQAVNFNQVANAGSAAVLDEAKLQEALVTTYNQGGTPDTILCTPIVAQRIANFNTSKVLYPVGGAPGGQNESTFKYISPFGYSLDVVPIRPDFLPSGQVLVLTQDRIKLSWLSNGVEIKDLPIVGDDVARKLIKAYLTLELRAYKHHAKITNVKDALS